tara:strand:- start:3969 stop:4376 length:408 start_codon:yes stop_codon:yes gene_type:complete
MDSLTETSDGWKVDESSDKYPIICCIFKKWDTSLKRKMFFVKHFPDRMFRTSKGTWVWEEPVRFGELPAARGYMDWTTKDAWEWEKLLRWIKSGNVFFGVSVRNKVEVELFENLIATERYEEVQEEDWENDKILL